MKLLAIDIGSSSVKAAIVHNQRMVGRVVRAEFKTRYDNTQAEVDPDAVLAAVYAAIRRLGAGVKSVDLIAPTVMAPSWLAMDRLGRPITPVVTHQDRRSIEIARQIEQRVGRTRHLKLAGNRPFPGGISSTTAAWFLKHQLGVMKRAATVGHLGTYLLHRWTGARVTDPSNASFMGLYQTSTLNGFSDELCEAIGLRPTLLPDVQDANVIAGHLSPRAANEAGLRAGTPVLTGCMDTSAAMFAVGAKTGRLLNSVGSTDVLAVCTDRAKPHERLLTRALGVGRRWMSVSTLAAGGSTLAWAQQHLFADLSEAAFFKLLKKLPPANGVTFEPYLSGERTSIEQKQAAFTGLTLATTREQMLAAVVDAVAIASAARLPLLQKVTRLSRRVIVTGGGGQDRLLHRDWGQGWRFESRQNLTTLGLAKLAAMAV